VRRAASRQTTPTAHTGYWTSRGFDDIFGADFCHPPLTTVTAPTEAAGRALVDVLLGDRSSHPERIVLPVRLRVRGSTGAPPTE
jgi:DNA-binding LacI/PurR family transcriptional regulator